MAQRTTTEAAWMYSVSPSTIRRQIRGGHLGASREGWGYRVTDEALAAWFQSLPDAASRT